VRTWTPQEWCGIKKDTRLGLRDNRKAFLASEDSRYLHIHSEKVTANKLHSIHQQKTGLIAQHMGYVKRIRPSGLDTRGTDTTILPILLAASMSVGPAWERARLLVDSGSEHPPLISQSLADWMGLHGPLAGGATQANEDYLPLYDVGLLHLGLNGKPVTEIFLSAPLSHHTILLGESWLKANSGIMDYAHGQLWQWTTTGIQRMSFDAIPHTQDGQPRETVDGHTQDPGTLDPLHRIVRGAIREGIKRASPPTWFLLPTNHFHRLQTVLAPVVPPSTPIFAIGSTANRPMGSRGRQLEARHFQQTVSGTPGPFMLGDFGKELPEDTHLDDLLDLEIPGLSAPPDRSSFDFVKSEVRAQLGHLSLQKQEDILTLLQGYEETVFETCTMPRMPPRHELDMDITETPGARPVSGRPYPVSPQHLSELER